MHFKRNNKEISSYLQGLRPFKAVLPKNIKKTLNRKGHQYSEILGKWNKLVGEDISKFSYPKSIKTTKDGAGNILILSIQRGNEINIEYSKSEIINKINSYFGYNFIKELKLETFPISNEKEILKKNFNLNKNTTKNYEMSIKKIKNTNIKNALYNLLNIIKK